MKIYPGQHIEYLINGMRNSKIRCGTVLQVTDKFIVVQGDKYRSTISRSDLLSGQVLILSGEEDSMGARDNMPPREELERVYIESGESINSVAKHFGVSWPTAKDWLQVTGLLNDTPISEPKNSFEDIQNQLREIKNQIAELQASITTLKQSTPTNTSDWDKFLQLLDKLMPYVTGRKEGVA